MKKFKLFALAAFAMLSTNAFANVEWANTTFTYIYSSEPDADNTVEATIKGFIQDYPTGDMETVTIPNTVKAKGGKSLKVVAIAEDAFKDNKNIKKVIFSGANLGTINAAFSGCTALAEVDFNGATGLTTIAEGAFAKCPITALDFSKTKLGEVNKLLGTDFDNATEADRVYNTSLTTLKLSAWWSSIAEEAFAGCTALATVDFNTVTTATGAPTTQTINAKAFAGCPVTALSFTGTKVTSLPANLLNDGTIYKKNESLASVTLTEKITALNAALSNCTALASVSGHIKTSGSTKTSALKELVNNEFLNDAALTSFDLSCVETLDTYAFSATGLTSVTFPKNKIAAIPEGCFYLCENLATITWDKDENATSGLASIATLAFAGTALTSVTIPAGAIEDADNSIAEKAFAACGSLTAFTWKPTTTPTNTVINNDAFYFCNDFITFATTDDYITNFATAPNHCTYGDNTATVTLTMTAYKNGSGKYYYKMKAATGKKYAVAKADAKVYDAYYDSTDDASLNMICYKPLSGYYQIAEGDVCLIVGNSATLEVYTDDATASGTSSSVATKYGIKALKMLDAATNRTTILLNEAPDEDYALYGWVNTASGTGFQKITSGSSMPAGTLYAFAVPADDEAAARIIWHNWDGSVEDETTAIQNVKESQAENGESFNMAGQRVANGYKGIVIKNGKKVILK